MVNLLIIYNLILQLILVFQFAISLRYLKQSKYSNGIKKSMDWVFLSAFSYHFYHLCSLLFMLLAQNIFHENGFLYVSVFLAMVFSSVVRTFLVSSHFSLFNNIRNYRKVKKEGVITDASSN